MPQYFFAILAGAKDTEPERSAVLKDDAAAFDYACELMQSDGSGDPSVLVKVRATSGRWCSQYRFWRPAPELKGRRARDSHSEGRDWDRAIYLYGPIYAEAQRELRKTLEEVSTALRWASMPSPLCPCRSVETRLGIAALLVTPEIRPCSSAASARRGQ